MQYIQTVNRLTGQAEANSKCNDRSRLIFEPTLYIPDALSCSLGGGEGSSMAGVSKQ